MVIVVVEELISFLFALPLLGVVVRERDRVTRMPGDGVHKTGRCDVCRWWGVEGAADAGVAGVVGEDKRGTQVGELKLARGGENAARRGLSDVIRRGLPFSDLLVWDSDALACGDVSLGRKRNSRAQRG